MFSSQKYLFLITIVAIGIGLVLVLLRPGEETSDPSASHSSDHHENRETIFPEPEFTPTPLEPGNALETFAEWLSEYLGVDPESRSDKKLFNRGLRLAEARFPLIRRLIHENPQVALSHALTFAEYDALPPEIQNLVEKPFSSVAELDVFPRCNGARANRQSDLPTPQDVDIHLNTDFGSLDAFTFGWRLEAPSRSAAPLQGIHLDGLAAVRPVVFQELPASDLPAAEKLFSVGNPDPGRGFASGQPLPAQPIGAVAGGRLFYFSSREMLQELESRAARLEEMIGENLGANLIFEALAAVGQHSDLGFDMAAVEESAKDKQSEAAKAVRKAIMIRIDFSDKTGSPIAVSTLQNRMDGEVNNQCRDMSFGDVTLDTTVETQLIRMPRPTTYYNGTDDGSKKNSALFNDAIAAAQAAGDHDHGIFPSLYHDEGNRDGLLRSRHGGRKQDLAALPRVKSHRA